MILPDGVRGIASTMWTAARRLWGATRSASQAHQRVWVERRADDERHGHFAGARVGAAGDGRVGDERVREQERLELGRRDLERVDLDQFLDAVDDEQVAVGVDAGEVAGLQPAVARGSPRN